MKKLKRHPKKAGEQRPLSSQGHETPDLRRQENAAVLGEQELQVRKVTFTTAGRAEKGANGRGLAYFCSPGRDQLPISGAHPGILTVYHIPRGLTS